MARAALAILATFGWLAVLPAGVAARSEQRAIALAPTHAIRGIVRSIADSSITIAGCGKKIGELTFVLVPATHARESQPWEARCQSGIAVTATVSSPRRSPPNPKNRNRPDRTQFIPVGPSGNCALHLISPFDRRCQPEPLRFRQTGHCHDQLLCRPPLRRPHVASYTPDYRGGRFDTCARHRWDDCRVQRGRRRLAAAPALR